MTEIGPALSVVADAGGVDEAVALADRIVVMSQGRISMSHPVALSAAEREAGVNREDLRATLLADLGLAGQP